MIQHNVGAGWQGRLAAGVWAAKINRSTLQPCNLLNSEEALIASRPTLAPVMAQVRLILMLRNPLTHVRSMHAHCRRVYGLTLSLEAWLARFSSPGSRTPPWGQRPVSQCIFHPRDMQTAFLTSRTMWDPTAKRNRDWSFEWQNDEAMRARMHTPGAIRAALHRVRIAAWHVGVVERYALSLCVLQRRLTSAPHFQSMRARSASELDFCDAGVRVTHFDHNSMARAQNMSATALRLILEMTQADHILHGAASERLLEDAVRFGALAV